MSCRPASSILIRLEAGRHRLKRILIKVVVRQVQAEVQLDHLQGDTIQGTVRLVEAQQLLRR